MYADVAHDVFVAGIADRRPEFHRPGAIDFNQDRGSLDSPLQEDMLDEADESAADALAPIFGRDNQPIQIASPTIERTQQRPDNRAINQRKQEDSCWIFREATYVPHFVG